MFTEAIPASRSTPTDSAACSGVCSRPNVSSTCGENDWMPSDTRVIPSSRHNRAFATSKVAGFASKVTSSTPAKPLHASCSARNNRRKWVGEIMLGVPPPK